MITMPDTAYVSIFMDNDLTHITEDHFEIKLIARLLDQIHVIRPPIFPPRYDDAPPQEYEYSQPHTSTDGGRSLFLVGYGLPFVMVVCCLLLLLLPLLWMRWLRHKLRWGML